MTDVVYGVLVKNKFALFTENEHDLSEIEEQLAAQEKDVKKKKYSKKKDVKKLPSQTTNKSVPFADKKSTTSALIPKQSTPVRTPNADSNGKEMQFSKPVCQEGHRGGAIGPSRPSRGYRPPRQEDRSPRFGGVCFTGGNNQETVEDQIKKGRYRRGYSHIVYVRGGRGRGFGFGSSISGRCYKIHSIHGLQYMSHEANWFAAVISGDALVE